MNILILEEDTEMARRLKRRLERAAGLPRVFLCRSANRAARLSQTRGIDLFIVDAASGPGMEFAGWIRGNAAYAMTWLVILAADDAWQYRAFNEFHCYYYMAKPCDLNDLADRVAELIRYEIVTTGSAYSAR